MDSEWSDDIIARDLADEPALSDELALIVERVEAREHAPHLVLDFRAVNYINSSNIAQLLRLRKVLAERGGQMRLCAVSEDVWSVLLVTGLDKVFVFAPDKLTALAGLQLDEADEEVS